ncbi:hypothetical protein [Marinobacter sp. ANT_B65]|uniref:hypothetical protein n=1 Tax=Marinobacter sp. ANT_B65 TaxID=2039467 RepID=UPI001D0CEC0B|nr:hypothetical protein [Marinobacter sp. ANT_B65]
MDEKLWNALFKYPPKKTLLSLKRILKHSGIAAFRKKILLYELATLFGVSDPEKLRTAIITGDPEYWSYRPFAYWDVMAISTVVNLAVGLEKGGHIGTFAEIRAKIKEIGLAVAQFHALYTRNDYEKKVGQVPGLLSLKQMADYHHVAFEQFNIPPSFYGGTWFGAIPEQLQFDTYGHLYCHDCDSTEVYTGKAQ